MTRQSAPVEAPATSPIVEAFNARVAEIELPGEAVAVWMKHRADVATLPKADGEAAWSLLCARAGEVGKMSKPGVWLLKAIAEEDARRTSSPDNHGAAA